MRARLLPAVGVAVVAVMLLTSGVAAAKGPIGAQISGEGIVTPIRIDHGEDGQMPGRFAGAHARYDAKPVETLCGDGDHDQVRRARSLLAAQDADAMFDPERSLNAADLTGVVVHHEHIAGDQPVLIQRMLCSMSS